MNSGVLISGMFTLERPVACKICGTTFLSRHSVGVQRTSVEDLPDFVGRLRPNIPVGWCMDGRDKITCVNCIMERDTPL
jgi:hypothetical protein